MASPISPIKGSTKDRRSQRTGGPREGPHLWTFNARLVGYRDGRLSVAGNKSVPHLMPLTAKDHDDPGGGDLLKRYKRLGHLGQPQVPTAVSFYW